MTIKNFPGQVHQSLTDLHSVNQLVDNCRVWSDVTHAYCLHIITLPDHRPAYRLQLNKK